MKFSAQHCVSAKVMVHTLQRVAPERHVCVSCDAQMTSAGVGRAHWQWRWQRRRHSQDFVQMEPDNLLGQHGEPALPIKKNTEIHGKKKEKKEKKKFTCDHGVSAPAKEPAFAAPAEVPRAGAELPRAPVPCISSKKWCRPQPAGPQPSPSASPSP